MMLELLTSFTKNYKQLRTMRGGGGGHKISDSDFFIVFTLFAKDVILTVFTEITLIKKRKEYNSKKPT